MPWGIAPTKGLGLVFCGVSSSPSKRLVSMEALTLPAQSSAHVLRILHKHRGLHGRRRRLSFGRGRSQAIHALSAPCAPNAWVLHNIVGACLLPGPSCGWVLVKEEAPTFHTPLADTAHTREVRESFRQPALYIPRRHLDNAAISVADAPVRARRRPCDPVRVAFFSKIFSHPLVLRK